MEKYQSHPFGDLLRQYISRRNGLSQYKLAVGIDVDPAVISDMSHGRRLSGPTARQRVLNIIRWLYTQGVLYSEEEATALLEAAGMAKLNTHLSNELGIELQKTHSQAASARRSQLVGSSVHLFRNRSKNTRIFLTVALGLAMMGIAALVWVLITTSTRSAPIWKEDFNPIEKRWNQISAVWEDIPGPTAILRESNPDTNYGKVESEVITADVDTYPILRVDVVAIDIGASYTVQVLDKATNIPRDIIHSIASPGKQIINIAQEMGWHGVQSFTINIWIGGEGKAVTLGLVSIGR